MQSISIDTISKSHHCAVSLAPRVQAYRDQFFPCKTEILCSTRVGYSLVSTKCKTQLSSNFNFHVDIIYQTLNVMSNASLSFLYLIVK